MLTITSRADWITAKQALGWEGIDLPFPINVVLLHDQLEEIDGDRRRQREGWPAGENPQPHAT